MKIEKKHRDKMKNDLKDLMKREPKPHEILNMETDALLLARMLADRIEDLESRVKDLEK